MIGQGLVDEVILSLFLRHMKIREGNVKKRPQSCIVCVYFRNQIQISLPQSIAGEGTLQPHSGKREGLFRHQVEGQFGFKK